jgi:hypothetical protein
MNQKNEAKHIVSKLADTINHLHFWDQKVRNDVLQFESLNLSQIKNRKILDSIDAISMKFIHDNKVKLYNLHLKPSIYTNLYILMLHNLGKEKANDELILSLYLNGFEKGVYSKQDIFSAIMRYLRVSTGKLDFNFDYLFEKIKSTDSYQIQYSKELINRIISKNEKYSFNNS